MDFSMIFSLVWKIVFAILKKEGLFDESLALDLPGVSGTTDPAQTPGSSSTGTSSPGNVLDMIIGSLGVK